MNGKFKISVPTISGDFELFKKVINMGIDARLEAFTKSDFYVKAKSIGGRLYLDIDESEMQILIRRLLETETESGELWADDIIEAYYGGVKYAYL